jgi:hypothetical protein
MMPAVVLLIPLAACNPRSTAQSRTASASPSSDSTFAQLQERGRKAMGVDQYSSRHQFEPLPDGGRISLTRDRADSAGVKQIRQHMVEIAAAFQGGNFRIPGFVHARAVPGSAVMVARRGEISYQPETLPLGGSLRIYSTDSAAVAAIHQFLAFQRLDHRAPHVDSH